VKPAILKFGFLLSLSAAALTGQQRLKPAVDPETREGLLIQQIQQERDPAAKVRLLESFNVQFPSHEAAPWVLDQLLPVYIKEGNHDRALVTADRLLAAFPEDLNYSNALLQAAIGKKDPATLVRCASQIWDTANKAIEKTPNAPPATAINLRNYAEYALYVNATQTPEPQKRLALLQALEKRNPKTSYSSLIQVEYFQIYRKLGQMDKALAIAEKATSKGASSEDMLAAIVDYYAGRNDNERVASNSAKLIQALNERTTGPEHMTQEEWERRRATMLSTAFYLGGMANSMLGRYATADRYLRAALPAVKGNPQQYAAVLYHLGLANYKLAENGEKGRVPEAIKYSEMCAEMRSTWSEQAAKNVSAIKAAYNIH
jgi:tetratricopeptide (TPR) repeat protein